MNESKESTEEKQINLDFIVYDDLEKESIWGVRPGRAALENKIDLDQIVRKFHKKMVCNYCGTEENVKVNILDRTPKNWIISNLEPICKDCFELHYSRTTAAKCTIEFRLKRDIFDFPLFITIEKPICKVTGKIENTIDIIERVEENIIAFFRDNPIQNYLPSGTIFTPEIIIMWIWKRLAQIVLVKGLKEIILYGEKTKRTITSDNMQTLLLNYCLSDIESRSRNKQFNL